MTEEETGLPSQLMSTLKLPTRPRVKSCFRTALWILSRPTMPRFRSVQWKCCETRGQLNKTFNKCNLKVSVAIVFRLWNNGYTCKSFIKLTSGLWFSLLEIEPRPNLLANVWRSALTFSVMVHPRAPYFPVQISPAFHSPHAWSLCVARDGWLRSTLKKMDHLYRSGSSRSAMTFNHLTSGIYLSVPVAIHVGAWGDKCAQTKCLNHLHKLRTGIMVFKLRFIILCSINLK